MAVALSFALAVVAGRVSGETGIAPIGAMGKVTQFVFAGIAPGNPTANLMSANVTGGAASQCSDMLHDLKTGHLLGAWPRHQAIAQTFGVLSGALAGSAGYLLLIPDPKALLITPEWPAPAVAQWKAVAELFTQGVESLPPGAGWAVLVACGLGILLSTLEQKLPSTMARYVPSAASLGLALVIPAYYSVSVFLGTLLAKSVREGAPHSRAALRRGGRSGADRWRKLGRSGTGALADARSLTGGCPSSSPHSGWSGKPSSGPRGRLSRSKVGSLCMYRERSSARGDERILVSSLVAVGSVRSETHQGDTHVVAGFECRRGVAPIVLEDVALVLEAELLAQVEQLVGQVAIERPGRIHHGDRHAPLARVLAWGRGGVVDGDHLRHVTVEDRGSADADLLGDCEEQVHCHRDVCPAVLDGFGRGEHRGNAGLVVEVARVDEAVVHFGVRIEGDEITDVEAVLLELFATNGKPFVAREGAQTSTVSESRICTERRASSAVELTVWQSRGEGCHFDTLAVSLEPRTVGPRAIGGRENRLRERSRRLDEELARGLRCPGRVQRDETQA